MFKTIVILLLFSIISRAFSKEEISKNDIEKAIDKTNLRHLYIYFTNSDKPAMLKRIRTDQFFSDIMKKLLVESNSLMYTHVEAEAPKAALNPRFDTDWRYENFIFKNTENAYKLAFLHQMTGEENYAQKAFEFVAVVCDQSTWVHGAHKFNIIYDRVGPWGAKDDQVAFGYSQWMDHIVFKMASVYD